MKLNHVTGSAKGRRCVRRLCKIISSEHVRVLVEQGKHCMLFGRPKYTEDEAQKLIEKGIDKRLSKKEENNK